MKVVARARAELAAERPWKARQRLQGALANDPANQEVLELLGEVCFVMRDLPAAGAYWFLTARRGADADAALAALHEQFPSPQALFTALPVKAPLEAYPAPAQERVRALLAHAKPQFLWRKKLERLEERRARRAHSSSTAWGDYVGIAIGVILFAVLVVGLVHGGYVVLKFLDSLL